MDKSRKGALGWHGCLIGSRSLRPALRKSCGLLHCAYAPLRAANAATKCAATLVSSRAYLRYDPPLCCYACSLQVLQNLMAFAGR